MSPRILHRINRELGVTSIDDLRKALADGRLMAMGGLARERKEAIARSLADNL
jgi:DNA polymerase/3'-5' exonuclease PolX